MNSPNERALWARVEAHLDARTDPFADAELAADLTGAPEVERAARRLVARLAGLAQQPAGHDRRSAVGDTRRLTPRRVAVLAAACLAVAVLGFALRGGGSSRGADEAPHGRADVRTAAHDADPNPADAPSAEAAPGTVYSASIEVERIPAAPPRAAVVVHEPTRIVGWTTTGNPRR